LFSHTVSKDLCLSSAFKEGFGPTVELLDDIAIDTLKDFDLMAIMVKGVGLDTNNKQQTRIATKSTNSNKLVALLA
jgi:translation initiation factor 4G